MNSPIKKGTPRALRQHPRGERVFSKKFPAGIDSHDGICFVPWEDFLELRNRYVKMFRRLQAARACASRKDQQ